MFLLNYPSSPCSVVTFYAGQVNPITVLDLESRKVHYVLIFAKYYE